MIPVIFAHGELGYPDELLYASFIIIFIGYIALSWHQGRNQQTEDSPQDESPTSNEDIES